MRRLKKWYLEDLKYKNGFLKNSQLINHVISYLYIYIIYRYKINSFEWATWNRRLKIN